jgi:hypothetical protein
VEFFQSLANKCDLLRSVTDVVVRDDDVVKRSHSDPGSNAIHFAV